MKKTPAQLAATQRWRAKNKLAIKKYNAEYHKQNHSDRIEYMANYRETNKEYFKKYDKLNSSKKLERTRYRQAKKLQATPKWLSEFDRNYIKCLYAQAAFFSKIEGISYHIDHIYPLQGENLSGLHVPTNLQILKASENLSKSNKSPEILS